MIEGIDVYRIYGTVKLHFNNSKFDVRYNSSGANKRAFTLSNFNKRNDKAMFEKIGRNFTYKKNLALYFASNMFYNPTIWIGDFIEEEEAAKLRYFELRKRQTSPYEYCEQDIIFLKNEYKSFTQGLDEGIIPSLLSEMIHPYTVAMLDRLFGGSILRRLNKSASSNVMWEVLKPRLQKYDAFLTLPSAEYRDTLKEKLAKAIQEST